MHWMVLSPTVVVVAVSVGAEAEEIARILPRRRQLGVSSHCRPRRQRTDTYRCASETDGMATRRVPPRPAAAVTAAQEAQGAATSWATVKAILAMATTMMMTRQIRPIPLRTRMNSALIRQSVVEVRRQEWTRMPLHCQMLRATLEFPNLSRQTQVWLSRELLSGCLQWLPTALECVRACRSDPRGIFHRMPLRPRPQPPSVHWPRAEHSRRVP